MSQADNVALRSAGELESFPGRSNLGGTFGDGSPSERDTFFQSTLIIARANGKLTRHDGASTYTDFSGTYSKPDANNKVRFAQAQRCLYFTTNAGVFRLDSPTGTPIAAGQVKPQELGVGLTSGGGDNAISVIASAFLLSGNAAGYRATLISADVNGRVLESTPTGRTIVANSTGVAGDVTIKLYLPPDATSSHSVRLYRTAQVASALDPGEEMGLVLEYKLTNADIANGFASLQDISPDALRGTTGYFCPSQEGLLGANEPPPVAKDIALFRDSIIFANVAGRQRSSFTMITVTGSGVGVANIFFLTPFAQTFAAFNAGVPVVSNTAGGFGNGGVATGTVTASAIEYASRALVQSINRSTLNTTVRAYYLSGADDFPGKILVEERAIGGAVFTMALASNFRSGYLHGSASSTSDAHVNRVMWSKAALPDAVPLTNFDDLGSQDSAILRVLALKDSVLIFKEDGVWKLTGSGPSTFSIRPLDTTLQLLAPDSLVALENKAVGVFNKGVLAISEAGTIEPIGFTRIDRTIRRLIATAPTQLQSLSFGLANESQREYELHLPSSSADTTPTQAFVYNAASDAWTRKVLSKTCGAVSPGTGGRPYYGNTTNTMSSERNAGTSADYQDEAGAALPEVVTFAPFTGGAPSAEKEFQAATFLFAGALPTGASASFSTNRSSVATVALAPANGTNPGVLPVGIPMPKNIGPSLIVGFTHSVAQEKLDLLGIVVDFKPVSDEGGR